MFFSVGPIATSTIVCTFVVIARATIATVFHAGTVLKGCLVFCEAISITVKIIVFTSFSAVFEVKDFDMVAKMVFIMVSFLAIHTVDRFAIAWTTIKALSVTWAFVNTQSILSHTDADTVMLIFTFRVTRN